MDGMNPTILQRLDEKRAAIARTEAKLYSIEQQMTIFKIAADKHRSELEQKKAVLDRMNEVVESLFGEEVEQELQTLKKYKNDTILSSTWMPGDAGQNPTKTKEFMDACSRIESIENGRANADKLINRIYYGKA